MTAPARDRLLLAIETSQARGGVALGKIDDRSAIDVEMLAPTSRHDDDLLPAIDRLMKRKGAASRDLAAVAVSIGPGGFTGLRIAVATAQVLAESLALRVVAVPSALVVAESADGVESGPMLLSLACKRDTMWLARVVRSREVWRIEGTPGLVEARDFDPWDATALVADEHLPAMARQSCDGAGVRIIPPRFDPAACWRVGARMLASGNVTAAADLRPHYAREPEAVSLWNAKAMRRSP